MTRIITLFIYRLGGSLKRTASQVLSELIVVDNGAGTTRFLTE